MELKFKKLESFYLLFFIAIGGVLFYMSSITKATIKEPLTARVYGMVVSGLFLAVVISRLVSLFIQRKNGDDDKKFTINHPMLILISAIAMIIYTISIIKIGYYVMTFLYTTLMVMLLRDKESRTAKSWVFTVVGCLIFTVALYFLFSAFNVYLPNAWLI